jgi:arginine exporter protein ArgO
VWAEVDTTAPNRKFQIIPIGTGWPLDAPAGKECILDTHTYISTIQMAGGSLVFHVYGAEILPTPVKEKKPETENVQKTKAKVNPNREASFTVTNCVINPEILQQFLI